MVSMLAFYSDDPSSNPAEVYNFSVKLLLKRTKINKKEAGLAHFLKKRLEIGRYSKVWIKNSQRNKFSNVGDASIAQLNRLCLTSCHPRFKSQAHHLSHICVCIEKRTKVNKKRPGLAHTKKQIQ